MDNMNDWCKEHHGKCGLTAAVLASKLTAEEAEEQLLSFVKTHVMKPKVAVLAGNSVHVDRSFLAIHMPRLIDHLHYRIIGMLLFFSRNRRLASIIALLKTHPFFRREFHQGACKQVVS